MPDRRGALAIVVSGARTVFDQLQPSSNPDIYEALTILVASILLAMLALFIPDLASALVTGGPALGAGALITSGLAVSGAGLLAGAVWGALVFPVIASFYWDKVTNRAFSLSVLAALALFVPVRFGWLPMEGVTAYAFDVLAVIGVGVVAGLMTFGFFGARAARIVGVVATLAVAPFAIGFLHQYAVLSSSLIAYAVSTIVCVLLSFRNRTAFDFDRIAARTGDFDVAPSSSSN